MKLAWEGSGLVWDGTWVVPAVAHTANARGDGCAERGAEAHIGGRAAGAADGGGVEMRW